MKAKIQIWAVSILATAMFFLFGCDQAPKSNGPVDPPTLTYKQVIKSRGEVPKTESHYRVGDPVFTEERCPGGFIQTVDDLDVIESHPNFIRSVRGILPGVLVDLSTLDKHNPDRVRIRQGGGVMYMNVFNGANPRMVIDEMTESKITAGINQYMACVPPITPLLDGYITYEIIESEEELATKLNTDFKIFKALFDGIHRIKHQSVAS